MKANARLITLPAVFLAFAIAFLYIGNVFPALRMAAVAAASLFTVAAVIETGLGAAVLVYIGGTLLGFLLLPDKTAAYLYAVFFGFYPIAKSLGERIRPPALQWAVKLAVFNAAFTAAWLLLKEILFDAVLDTVTGLAAFGLPLIYLAGNAAFVLFDIGLTRLISFYIVRISKQLKKTDNRGR